MFLKRLFGRKPQASKVVDRDQLIETALHSPDSAARRDACHALVDLPTLRQVAYTDAIIGIRELANARYRNLLCGLDPQSPDLSERLAELARIDDQGLLSQAAIQASDAQLRGMAIDAVDAQDVLVSCAIDDALAANRLRAAERVHDKSALEQIARRAAKRDKTVYRLARQRLKQISDSEERPRLVRAQCQTLCEKLERLGRFENWVQDHALLGHIEQQWAELEAEADIGIRNRYLKLRQNFVDAYNAYAQQHAAQLAEAQAQADAEARRRALVAELKELAAMNNLDQIVQRVAEIEQIWDDIQPVADKAALRAYREALTMAGEQRATLEDDARRERIAATLLDDAKALLKRNRELDRKRVAALRQRLERLRSESEGHRASSHLGECAKILEQLQQRIDKQRDQAARKLAALPERLAELDRHFEQGKLKKAEPLYQSITATLKQARAAGLPRQDLAPVELHLKQIAPQLHELQRWRRWGADTKREDLCAQLEALAEDSELEMEPMANRLRELRNLWRELDRNGAPAEDALWQRFQAAGNRVQEHCQPFLETRAKIRAANQKQREALCKQLETFLNQVDWERMDWKKAARAEREMRQAWSALGPLEGNRQKPLEGRFRKLLRQLDQALDAERQKNRAFKEELIQRMLALVEEPDLRRAIDMAKDLQQQWQTTVPGRQRDENALWKTFRSASDAVFARRAEQQQARDAEMREHQTTREEICDELVTLIDTCSDPDSLRADLHSLEKRWHDTHGLPLPRQVVQGLQRRWNTTFDRAKACLQSLEAKARWTAIEHLEQRAAFCDKLARKLIATAEQAASNTEPNSPEDAGADATAAAWAALPAIDDPDLHQQFDRIFTQIADAANNADAKTRLMTSMAEHARQRIDLCLHLEITAGTDSPPELHQQRMELQVSRLREHMGDGAADPIADAFTLLRKWYLCTPADAIAGLDQRFARVKQALTVAQQPSGDE